MIPPGSLQKKFVFTIVFLCVIFTTFLLTRNARAWRNGYVPSDQDMERNANNSVQLSPDIQSRIKSLALFIGYPRSGHTLIGSLLDAHPHIIIANELDIFESWTTWSKDKKTRANLINKMYENSYSQSFGVGFRSATKSHGRTYAVPNQWQGKYKDYIKVIGDKKGGKTTRVLATKPEIVKQVDDKLNLPMKLVHMVRNPYDNIATMLLRQLKIKTTDALSAKRKTNNTKALAHNLKLYLWSANKNNNLISLYGSNVLTLHSEDVIDDPKETLKKLCQFLDVVCTEDYLKDCASIIYKNPSKTRRSVVWPPLLKRKVGAAIKRFPFLRRYSYDL